MEGRSQFLVSYLFSLGMFRRGLDCGEAAEFGAGEGPVCFFDGAKPIFVGNKAVADGAKPIFEGAKPIPLWVPCFSLRGVGPHGFERSDLGCGRGACMFFLRSKANFRWKQSGCGRSKANFRGSNADSGAGGVRNCAGARFLL